MDKEKTKVIFRKYIDGEILALFPEEIGSRIQFCSSYLHVGQHGDAEPSYCIEETALATSKEYKSLLKELKEIGYNLVICKRYTLRMDSKRSYREVPKKIGYDSIIRKRYALHRRVSKKI